MQIWVAATAKPVARRCATFIACSCTSLRHDQLLISNWLPCVVLADGWIVNWPFARLWTPYSAM